MKHTELKPADIAATAATIEALALSMRQGAQIMSDYVGKLNVALVYGAASEAPVNKELPGAIRYTERSVQAALEELDNVRHFASVVGRIARTGK